MILSYCIRREVNLVSVRNHVDPNTTYPKTVAVSLITTKMSGFEAIGVALGILPLLISAIEHYNDVIRPLSRYRHFTSKAQRFMDEIETEKTIFCTECQLLLATVANPILAEDTIRNLQHPSWVDKPLHEKLNRHLGPHGTTCNLLIVKINSKLVKISNASEKLNTTISENKKVRHGPVRRKAILQHVFKAG